MMKIIALRLATVFGIIAFISIMLIACGTHRELPVDDSRFAPTPSSYLPQIIFDGATYYLDSRGRQMNEEFELTEDTPRILSTVPLSQIPTENWQANFGEAGAPCMRFDDGVAVLWNGIWRLFVSENELIDASGFQEMTLDDVVEIYAPAEMPDDFNFAIDFGIMGKNNIDTYSSTLTKDIIIAGRETIPFTIPADKMQEIYEAFAEYQIPGLPADINAFALSSMGDRTTCRTPASTYTLTYTCNGATRTIVCDDGGPWDADAGPPDARDRLVALVESVAEYIYGTEEYQKMPPAEGGYI